MKECKNCKKILGIDSYNKLKRGKDGYNTVCRNCVNEKRKKPNKEACCNKCGKKFLTNRRKNCSKCLKSPTSHSYDECLFYLKKCDSKISFQKKYANLYSYAQKNNLLEKLYREANISSKRIYHTYDECLNKAKLCNNISDFNIKYKKYYSAAHRRGWLQSIYNELEFIKNNGGYSLSRFKRACELNNNKGIFYILRCFDENESFYKIGITSQTINLRYKDSYRMPYSYVVLLQIEDDPNVIWKIEKNFKKRIKPRIYIPIKAFNGSITECFH